MTRNQSGIAERLVDQGKVKISKADDCFWIKVKKADLSKKVVHK